MIDPRGLSPVQWADAVAIGLGRLGVVDRLESDVEWRSWAARICAAPVIGRQAPPDPFAAATFEQWAEGFLLAVGLGD